MSELMEELRALYNVPAGFPSDYRGFGMKLKRIMPTLRKMGVRKEDVRKRDRTFRLTLEESHEDSIGE